MPENNVAETSANLYRQILSMQPSSAVAGAVEPAVRSSAVLHTARILSTPAFIAGAVAFAGCTVALTTQPTLRRWLTRLWDGDVEARKLRKRIAKANKKVAALLLACQTEAGSIEAKLEQLRTDLARWERESVAAFAAAAARQDPNHQKHSGFVAGLRPPPIRPSVSAPCHASIRFDLHADRGRYSHMFALEFEIFVIFFVTSD
jgi:hypothetical protein